MTLGPLMIDVAGKHLTVEDRELLAHPLVGSVILFTRNYEDPTQLAQLVGEIQSIRSPALLVAVDHEGGRVQRFRPGFSLLPAVRSIGHHYDLDRGAGLDMARHMGWLMAAELLACGIDFSFAPCVDLDYGVSEIIGDRAFHARAAAVGELAVAYMHGMRDAGMAATAKHFPGHGAVVADSHVALPVDRRELVDMEQDLAPYRLLIANGLPAVMVAHVLYPAVDPVPASFSRRWIGGILRRELRFAGVVFADDLSMAGAEAVGGVVERAERALAAGCDVLPICNARASAIRVLDELAVPADPASKLRLVRLRGRRQPGLEALRASAAWAEGQQWLARSTATPELKLEAGAG
ncbi:MAG TPA: beta-N-acetylhexosaminidase [Steroidobacteraceae bacterium]|nr:beta-N-acetylhexosaminidase [Steroidobacteraceae bacterium]